MEPKKLMSKRLMLCVAVLVFVIAAVAVFIIVNRISAENAREAERIFNLPENVYARALELLDMGNYEAALDEIQPIVRRIQNEGFRSFYFEDAAVLASYAQAQVYYMNRDYMSAANYFFWVDYDRDAQGFMTNARTFRDAAEMRERLLPLGIMQRWDTHLSAYYEILALHESGIHDFRTWMDSNQRLRSLANSFEWFARGYYAEFGNFDSAQEYRVKAADLRITIAYYYFLHTVTDSHRDMIIASGNASGDPFGQGNPMHPMHNDYSIENLGFVFSLPLDGESPSREIQRRLDRLNDWLRQLEREREIVLAEEARAEQFRLAEQAAAERIAQAEASIALAQVHIVGTWIRGEISESRTTNEGIFSPTNLGDTLIFRDDGTVELREGNLITSGRYFFEDVHLVIRMPGLLPHTEVDTRLYVFMDEQDSMMLEQTAVIAAGGIGWSTFFSPTTYTRR